MGVEQVAATKKIGMQMSWFSPRAHAIADTDSVLKVETDCDWFHIGPHLDSVYKQRVVMTFITVQCPHYHSEQIIKRGKTARGTQRYLCQNTLYAKGVSYSPIATEGACLK
jgi:hypothetical protein